MSVAKDFLAAYGGLSLVCTAITAVWFALLARARRHALENARQDEAIDMVTGPSNADIERAIDDYYKKNGGRP